MRTEDMAMGHIARGGGATVKDCPIFININVYVGEEKIVTSLTEFEASAEIVEVAETASKSLMGELFKWMGKR